MKVGILALQGAYNSHQKKIQELGVNCILVKNKVALAQVDALILPGGESTTMTYLLQKHQLWQPIIKSVQEIPILATCAGVVLLHNMGLLEINITRNGYGRQLESEIFSLTVNLDNAKKKIEAYFIRAPIINAIYSPEIQIMSYHVNKPVLIKKNNILAATFHPEFCQDSCIHEYFIGMISF